MYFGLGYLSRLDRTRLEEIQARLDSIGTPKDQLAALLEERAEIEGRRKKIADLSQAECMELRNFLYTKYGMLKSIGKGGIAMQFRALIQQVDQRISTIQIEKMKDLQEQQSKPPETPIAKPSRKSSTVAKSNRNKWSIRISS